MSRTKRNILIFVLAIASAAIGIAVAVYVVDVHEDRQYDVRITGPVWLFNSESPSRETRGSEGLIQVLEPNDQVKVLRILHGRDYDAIRVRLENGSEGYIFLGDNFELSR